MSQPRLYPVACESKDFALTGYADTIICEPGIGNNDSTLIGIRLGGEPAATQALATVLRTGVPFRITVDGNEFTCQGDKHKYSLQYGAAVPYCEALLTIQDEEIEGKEKVRDRESSVSFIKSRVHFLCCWRSYQLVPTDSKENVRSHAAGVSRLCSLRGSAAWHSHTARSVQHDRAVRGVAPIP